MGVVLRHAILASLEKDKITKLEVPAEYLHGRALAKDFVDPATGELLLECNTEITVEVVEQFVRLV